MWFKSPFKKQDRPKPKDDGKAEQSINQGIFYLYLIIGVQVLVVFGLLTGIMFIGKVIATPMWVFLFAFILAVSGFVYIYHKAKQQFRKFRESFREANVSDRNYEISFMGGFLTMRVEQNPNRLLEAPPAAGPIVEADTIEIGPPPR
ncbi:MAG: hypothetical protein HPY84_00985 [Syntrophobacteraceae bacterium]|jgi:hypothetical protein|nr:hypothetical protein [Syntrophobacteraceae bacterium]